MPVACEPLPDLGFGELTTAEHSETVHIRTGSGPWALGFGTSGLSFCTQSLALGFWLQALGIAFVSRDWFVGRDHRTLRVFNASRRAHYGSVSCDGWVPAEERYVLQAQIRRAPFPLPQTSSKDVLAGPLASICSFSMSPMARLPRPDTSSNVAHRLGLVSAMVENELATRYSDVDERTSEADGFACE